MTIPLRSDADLLTGRTFGVLEVGEVVERRHYPSGQSVLVYEVRCTRCGKTSRLDRKLIVRAHRFCSSCVRTLGAAAQSVALPDGRTLLDVANASGLPLDTVHKRWARGWPLERLADPPRARGEAQRSGALGGGRTVRHFRAA